MTHQHATRWLHAIGGTCEVIEEAGGRWFVVVSVESATKGRVSRRMTIDGFFGGERDEAVRRAFVRACVELEVALG